MNANAGQRMTRRQRAKALTRQRILTISRQMFIEKGYLRTTLRDIAIRAGMSTGAFFSSFESKEACLEAIIAEEHAEELALLDASKYSSRIATEAIRGVLSQSYVRWGNEVGLLRAWMTQYWDGHDELEKLTRTYVNHVADVVKQILALQPESHDIGRLSNAIASFHMENLRYLAVETKGDPTFPEIRLGVQLELLITHGQHLGPGCA